MSFKENKLFTFVVVVWSLLAFGNANGNTFPLHESSLFSVNQSSENLRLLKRKVKRRYRKLKPKNRLGLGFKNTLKAVLKVFVIPYAIGFGLVGLFALLFGKSLTIWQLLLLSLGVYASCFLIIGIIVFIGYHSSGTKPRPRPIAS